MSEIPDAIATMVEKAVVLSPYGRLLGMELLEAQESRVRVALPYREELTTYGDTVHGGAISALVDVAATACFWSSSSVIPGSKGATIGFSVNFLSGARGRDLVATAEVLRRGREISTGRVSVCDSEGVEVAVALVSYKLSSPT